MMLRTPILSAALTAFALSLVGAPAAAAPKEYTVVGKRPADDQLQERVRYGDLNLVTRAGQKSLDRRVGRAVEMVCAPHFSGSSSLSFIYDRCRDFAWDGAEPQIALAIQRANEIAATGRSSIPPVAIAISGAFAR